MRRIAAAASGGIRLVAVALILTTGACKDFTGAEAEHHEPAGLRATLGGTTVVSVNAARQVTGAFSVAAGTTTEPITVGFLADDGDVIQPEAEEYLEVEVDAPTLATVVQNPGGSFTIQFAGLVTGATTVRLQLMHGAFPTGHPDYTSPNIVLTVAP
jgi:hypothetical protein